MKNLLPTVLMYLIVITWLPVHAQEVSEPNPNMDSLIIALQGSNFIQSYQRYRNEVEAKVMALKLEQNAVTPKDFNKIKLAYARSQSRFDAVLNLLKQELAQPTLYKSIHNAPYPFTQRFNQLFHDARLQCNHTVIKKINGLLHATDRHSVSSNPLLMESFVKCLQAFLDNQTNEPFFDAAYLDNHFMESLRFKTWDTILY